MEKEVRGSRLRRIPLSRLLVIHLLIAILLTLALVQPKFLLSASNNVAKQVIIMIDVSTSMLAQDVFPSRLIQAKQEATALLSGLGPQDSAAVVSFANKPSWIGANWEMEIEFIYV